MRNRFLLVEGALKRMPIKWNNTAELSKIQRRIQGGSIGSIATPRLKPTKVTLFTMILYNWKNSIRNRGNFVVHCFVTAV